MFINIIWNPTNFHSDLTMKQLNSKDACADSTWTPLNATSAKIKPLPCDGIWKKSPYGMNIFAKSSKDTAGMIDGFEIKLEFKDDDHFEEEFKNIKLL